MNYIECIEKNKEYCEAFDSIYKLSTNDTNEINAIFDKIKKILISSNYFSPAHILIHIQNAALHRNRFFRGYWMLFKKILDEFQPTKIKNISLGFDYIIYQEYHKFFNPEHQRVIKTNFRFPIDVHEDNNNIYKVIMNDDKENFIFFIEQDEFDEYMQLTSYSYPYQNSRFLGYSLVELCCYHGAVNCFKLLLTKFKPEITPICL